MIIQLVYVGACQSGGDLVHGYVPLGPAGDLTDRAWTFAEQLTDHPPGSQLRFETGGNDPKEIDPESAVFERTWPDEDLVVQWAAHHEVAIAGHLAFTDDPPIALRDQLRPIQVVYESMGPEDRAQLIAQVVRVIVGT